MLGRSRIRSGIRERGESQPGQFYTDRSNLRVTRRHASLPGRVGVHSQCQFDCHQPSCDGACGVRWAMVLHMMIHMANLQADFRVITTSTSTTAKRASPSLPTKARAAPPRRTAKSPAPTGTVGERHSGHTNASPHTRDRPVHTNGNVTQREPWSHAHDVRDRPHLTEKQ